MVSISNPAGVVSVLELYYGYKLVTMQIVDNVEVVSISYTGRNSPYTPRTEPAPHPIVQVKK